MSQKGQEQIKRLKALIDNGTKEATESPEFVTAEEMAKWFKGIVESIKSLKSSNDQEIKEIITHVSKINQMIGNESNLTKKQRQNLEQEFSSLKQELSGKVQDIERKIPKDILKRADLPTFKAETPESIRNKLETLKKDERLDKKAIKGLENILTQKELDRAISILDQRTQFLINKVSNVEQDVESRQYKVFVTVGSSDADYIVDGVNDQIQIQAAGDYVNGLGGGVVYILEGQYSVTSRVNISGWDNVTIMGAGKGATVLGGGVVNDYTFFSSTAVTNFVLSDMTIDSENKSNASGYRLYYATGCVTKNVEFKNVEDGGWHMKIGVVDGSTEAVLNFNNKIIDCDFETHDGSLEMLLIFNAQNTEIIRPRFTNKTSNGPIFGLWQKCYNTFIDAPYFHDNEGTCIYYSVTVEDTIINNPIFENSGHGIAGANVSDNGAFGLTQAQGLIINNPILRGGANSSGKNGIQLGAVNNAQITNPLIEEYSSGIIIDDGNSSINFAAATNWSILGGQIRNCNFEDNNHTIHNAIKFNSIGGDLHGTIHDVKMYDDQATKTQRYPISFNGGFTYDYITIRDCRLSADIANSGTSIRINNSSVLGPNVSIYGNQDFSGTNPGQSNIVIGPTTSTDLAVARFDGTTGGIVQNSKVLIGDNGGISTTIANSGNEDALTIVQNDTTNNKRGIDITNAGTGNSIFVDANGDTGTAINTSGAVLVNNSGNDGIGLNVYSANAAGSGTLVSFYNDNATSTQRVLDITQDSNTKAVLITTSGTSVPALDIQNAQTFTGTTGSALLNVQLTGASATGTAATIRHNATGLGLFIDKNGTNFAEDIDHDVTNVNWTNGSLRINATSTVNDAATYTKSGSIVLITSDVVETSGTITDTSITLSVNQTHADASGNLIFANMDGTGKAIFVDHDDTGTNPSVDIDRDGNNAALITGLKINTANAGAGGARSLWIEAGTAEFDGRILGGQGADIASANDLTLGADGNTFEITGTTQVNAIITANWQNGSLITLLFTSTPTVKHNTAGGAGTVPILLAGAVDFVASAGDTLSLRLCEIGGTQAWREIGRAVI